MTATDKAEREELRKMLPKNISRPLSYEDKIRFSCFSEREMLDFAQQVLERERASRWIPVTETDKLPAFGRPVFMRFSDGRIRLGGRVYDSEGWLWCRCYGDPNFDSGKLDAEMEADDDYQPTHFQYLPEPMEGA